MAESTASQQPTVSPPVPPIKGDPWDDLIHSGARFLTSPWTKTRWAFASLMGGGIVFLVGIAIYSGTQLNKIGDLDDDLKDASKDLKAVTGQLAATQSGVAGLVGRFDATEKAISKDLANVSVALAKQAERTDRLGEKAENLERGVIALSSNVGRLDARVEGVERGVTNIADKVGGLEKHADSTDAKLDRLTDAVNQVAENVKKLTDPRAQVDPDQQLRQMMAMRLGAIEEKVGGIALWESCNVVLSRKNLLPNGEGSGLTFRVSPEEIEDDAKLTLILARVAKDVEGYLVRNADLSRQVPREVNSKVRYAEDGAILVSFTATDPNFKRVLDGLGEAFLKSDDKPGPVTVVFPRRKD